MQFNSDEIENIKECPWCSRKESNFLYTSDCDVVRCNNCGFVYAKKILNSKGREKYWNDYCEKVHLASEQLNKKRNDMYKLEVDYIDQFMHGKKKEVLDIGCSKGEYLDSFKERDYECYGVEYDEIAAAYAMKKYTVWKGDLQTLDISKKFPLITIRGTIQYFINPRTYFDKIVSWMEKDGLLFISSSPNADSLCFDLFKENFTLPVKMTDYWGYSKKLLTEYMNSKGVEFVSDYDFYEQTPYCDLKNDIERVAEKLRDTKNCIKKSPAFYGNMLTLVYRKK